MWDRGNGTDLPQIGTKHFCIAPQTPASSQTNIIVSASHADYIALWLGTPHSTLNAEQYNLRIQWFLKNIDSHLTMQKHDSNGLETDICLYWTYHNHLWGRINKIPTGLVGFIDCVGLIFKQCNIIDTRSHFDVYQYIKSSFASLGRWYVYYYYYYYKTHL